MNDTTAAHLRFLGLHRDPFPVVPDPLHMFLPSRIDALVAEVLHGIRTRKGFLVLAGEVGLGKTTISRRILDLLEGEGVETALVLNSLVQGLDLLREINRDFGIAADPPELPAQMSALHDFLLARSREEKNCAIVIDDAQNLTVESLEMVRLISNLETHSEKLVQILLVGQPELLETLDAHRLRQLKSRVVVQLEVRPFDLDEVKQYILFKLTAAGHHGALRIDEPAFRAIHRLTAGNPRRINILMDRCLYGLFAEDTTRLTARLVTMVAAELEMAAPPRLPLPAWLLPTLLPALGGAALAAAAVVALQSPPAAVTAPTAAQTPPAAASQTAAAAAPAAAAATAGETAPAAADDDQVARFLAAYDLADRAPLFARALQEGWVERLGEQIAEATGWRLVSLPAPPAAAPPALLPAGDGSAARYLFFWRPAEWVGEFRFGLARPELIPLQRRLARLGLYDGHPDGVAGRQTMIALTAFQRRHHLPTSGLPDVATQYLLSELAP